MPALSNGWGRSVLVYTGCAFLGIIGSFSVALSPVALSALQADWFPIALRATCGFVIFSLSLLPLVVANGPADVSTECDDLLQALNQLRIRLMTQGEMVDSEIKISALENTMSEF